MTDLAVLVAVISGLVGFGLVLDWAWSPKPPSLPKERKNNG